MTRLFRILKRKANVRRLLAAGLLVIAFVDLGSHALANGNADEGGAPAWCLTYHYTNSSVDCPHKRDHRVPDKSAFDDMGHNALIEPARDLSVSGIVYRTDQAKARKVLLLDRILEPPTQPPKQA